MDAYTKIVLTVIATALTAIALQHAGIVPAFAQSNAIQRVAICNWDGSGCTTVFKNALYVLPR
jgi:hypothetical protein